MPKHLFVGGPRHGEWLAIPSHEYVVVSKPPGLWPGLDCPSQPVETDTYRREKLVLPNGEVKVIFVHEDYIGPAALIIAEFFRE